MNLKIGEFTILHLYKRYFILSIVNIIKKLIQQYIKLFYVLKKVERLSYCLNIPANQRIYNVFTIAQLEPVLNPAIDLFQQLWPNYFDSVFVEKDINSYKLFKIKYLLNKHITKQNSCRKMQYLVCWKRYRLEFNKQYNKTELKNACELIENYKHKVYDMKKSCNCR